MQTSEPNHETNETMKQHRTPMTDPRADYRGLSKGYLETLQTEGLIVAAAGLIVAIHAAAAAVWLAPSMWSVAAAAAAVIGGRLTWGGAKQAVRAGEERERSSSGPC